MSKINPVDAVLAVTYQCNSRCVMCDIWKNQEQPLMKPEDYLKLPKSLKDINISGGEPFLRKDIVEVLKNVKKACPKARILFSSNGLVPELIVPKMAEIKRFIPNIGFGISIDGLGEMHDKIRGMPGAYNNALKTVEQLKIAGIHNIRFAFTVSTLNVTHLAKTYDLSRNLGVQFTMAFAQSSDFYFGGKQNYENPDQKIMKEEFDHLIAEELKSFHPKRWVRAYFAEGLYNFATNKKQALPSQAGTDFFFVDPQANIYPSVVHNHIMGNLLKKDFESIWTSKKAEKIRAQIKKEKKPVWMICTARTAIKKHPIKVGKWILKKKVKK